MELGTGHLHPGYHWRSSIRIADFHRIFQRFHNSDRGRIIWRAQIPMRSHVWYLNENLAFS